METDFIQMWKELGVNIELHNKLLAHDFKLHTQTHLSQKNRPSSMKLFDEAVHASHKQRVSEILEYRKQGGKSIGTFCIYIPDEIALAAEVLPIPLCGGSSFPVVYADKMLPRDICPILRSTFGMALSGTCPYKKLKEAAFGETTCDGKKKTWDLFGFEVLEVPQKKNDIDMELWLKEVYGFKDYMEKLSGVKITIKKLKESIYLVNEKRKVLQSINNYRRFLNPPISGLDALLISQTALNMDVKKFINAGKELIEELEHRVNKNISAYENNGGIRVLVAGTPSPMGNAKVHHAIETSGMQIVADESCTGMRYFRNLVDDTPENIDELIKVVADRYLKIDCPCFSPNKERIENITQIIDEYKIKGVIHNILSFCHGFNIEAKKIDMVLNKLNIPSLKIVTDYSYEDIEQIKVRTETFAELISS